MNKRIKRTAVSRWMAMTAAALTLGACSQSEEAVEMLPEGKYPIELTATGLEPAVTPMTRTTVDGDWDGVTTVAVQVDGVVKEYSVDVSGSANKKAAVLKAGEGVDPFYWKSTADIKVSAWWPYSDTKPATVALVTDQRDEKIYQKCDLIMADNQDVKYAAPTLKFTHRTAKVCVNVVNGGDTPAPMAVDGVEVTLGSNTVKPYKPADGNYRCLIPGGTATDANKLSVKITIDGATYVYTHPSEYTFEANKQYTFTLTVNRDGIQLNRCTISDWDTSAEEVKGEAKQPSYEVDAAKVWHIYNAEGLKAWGDKKVDNPTMKCSAVLENDIVMPAPEAGKGNWTPVPSYYGTFDGNGHTISGLVIRGSTSDQGFFAFIKGDQEETGEVRNLTLKDVTIVSEASFVGAIAGDCAGRINGCRVIGGTVKGSSCVGGLVGQYNREVVGQEDDIYACSAQCAVEGYASVGGLIGNAASGKLKGCWADCALQVDPEYSDEIGGLAGGMGSNFIITYSYWAGSGAEHPVGWSRLPEGGEGFPTLTSDAKVSGDWTTAIEKMNRIIYESRYPNSYTWKKGSDGKPVLE